MTIWRTSRRGRPIAGFVVAVGAAGLLLASGCADTGGDPAGGSGLRSAPSQPVPDNAIAVSDELYYVPLAEPVQGCRAYRQFSPTRAVTAAIYFRTADGRFVLDRNQAVCD